MGRGQRQVVDTCGQPGGRIIIQHRHGNDRQGVGAPRGMGTHRLLQLPAEAAGTGSRRRLERQGTAEGIVLSGEHPPAVAYMLRTLPHHSSAQGRRSRRRIRPRNIDGGLEGTKLGEPGRSEEAHRSREDATQLLGLGTDVGSIVRSQLHEAVELMGGRQPHGCTSPRTPV